MRTHPHLTFYAVLAAGLAAALTAASPAHAGTTVPGAVTSDLLAAATAVSSSDAWAVGDGSSTGWEQTLVEHWNGAAWKIVASPNPGGHSANNELDGVAATSVSNAWAVGQFWNGDNWQPLTVRWNGKSWKRVPCPDPGGKASRDGLAGVAATSASNAWAVGVYSRGSAELALILHWNGRSWRQVSRPLPRGSTASSLSSVTAVSRSNAWAVGAWFHGLTERTLIEHWNGRSWRLVPSRNVAVLRDAFNSVIGSSAGNMWATGASDNGSVFQTLTEHWNGRSWRLVPSADPSGSSLNNELFGVDVVSPVSAWAVGDFFNGSDDQLLIEHWDGKTWQQSSAQDPPGFTLGTLLGVAGAPSGRAWAVGFYVTGASTLTVIEHWNGSSWQVSPSPNR